MLPMHTCWLICCAPMAIASLHWHPSAMRFGLSSLGAGARRARGDSRAAGQPAARAARLLLAGRRRDLRDVDSPIALAFLQCYPRPNRLVALAPGTWRPSAPSMLTAAAARQKNSLRGCTSACRRTGFPGDAGEGRAVQRLGTRVESSVEELGQLTRGSSAASRHPMTAASS